ncbi:MAG: efflux RND transporter periplasmic adaptor subunit [Richelia sp. RM1_1_1]|nr:efflux RND transporter periplasmic adaptor subunit [Richelia sp. SM1_7_0]NJN09532.1 efflux RND transporter periplasmic adaptor subunit [Richelia sp. RM1_1_1]
MNINTSNSTQSSSEVVIDDIRKKNINSWITKLLIFCLFAGISAVAIRFFQLSSEKNSQIQLPTQVVERQNLNISVTANGKIQAERSINLSPKNAGIIRTLLVKEGDAVKKGQIIAYMDDSNLQGQLTQAKAGIASAEASLQKLIAGNRTEDIAQSQAQLEEAQANLNKLITGNRPQDIAQFDAKLRKVQASLRQAESDLKRYQELFDAGAISRQSLSTYETNKDTALAQVEEAEQALKLQKAGSRSEDIEQARAKVKQLQQSYNLTKAGTRKEDIDQARAQVNSQRGSLQTTLAQINDTVIRAPFDGVVTKKYADPGSFVTPNSAGGSSSSSVSSSILALTANNQVVANVSESNLAKIRIGQTLKIKTDAYPNQVFTGRVSQIAAQATVEQNVTSFEVKAEITSNNKNLLRSGMNVEVEFEIGKQENALVVPTVAVIREQRGTGVYILNQENQAVFIPIKIGVAVKNKTEVKSGLKGNERVLLTLPPEIKDKPKSGGLFSPPKPPEN